MFHAKTISGIGSVEAFRVGSFSCRPRCFGFFLTCPERHGTCLTYHHDHVVADPGKADRGQGFLGVHARSQRDTAFDNMQLHPLHQAERGYAMRRLQQQVECQSSGAVRCKFASCVRHEAANRHAVFSYLI